MAAFFLLTLLHCALALGLCYVTWQYATSLQAIAGRHQSDPTTLCQRHLLCWRLKVAMIVLLLAAQGLGYLYSSIRRNWSENSVSQRSRPTESF
jgi:hypothetical protein